VGNDQMTKLAGYLVRIASGCCPARSGVELMQAHTRARNGLDRPASANCSGGGGGHRQMRRNHASFRGADGGAKRGDER